MTVAKWGTSVWGGTDDIARLGALRDVEVQVTAVFMAGEPVWDHATDIVVGYAQEVSTALDKVVGNIVYACRARYRDVFAQASPWSDTALLLTVRDHTAPETPTGLFATSDGLGLHVTWDAVTAADIAFYRLRAAPSVAGIPSGWVEYDTKATSYLLPVVTGPYWLQVKAIDTSGNESAWS